MPAIITIMLFFLVALLAIVKLTGLHDISWMMVTSPIWVVALIIAGHYYLKFFFGLIKHIVIDGE